jgi:hypothetical protein
LLTISVIRVNSGNPQRLQTYQRSETKEYGGAAGKRQTPSGLMNSVKMRTEYIKIGGTVEILSLAQARD